MGAFTGMWGWCKSKDGVKVMAQRGCAPPIPNYILLVSCVNVNHSYKVMVFGRC